MAMVFVIYGHIANSYTVYFVFTSPIKISLFFAITGYVFNGNRTTKDFYNNIIRKLVIPWIILGMSIPAVMMPFKDVEYFIAHLKSILTGETFWYMPCCIIAEIIWFNLLKLCKKDYWIIITAIILFLAGLTLDKFSILDICMINVAFVVQLYILIGYIYKKLEAKIGLFEYKLVILGIAIYIALGIITLEIYPGQSLDIHVGRYYNLPICILMIYLGCFAVLIFASKIKKIPKWLCYIGRNTLVIYIYHGYVLEIFKRISGSLNIYFHNWAIAIIITIITVAICCLLSWLINLLLPELLGKRRRKKT